MDKLDKIQKKPTKQPVTIRQTKTSIYRLAKANPLLIRDKQIKVGDKDVRLPLAVTYHRRLTLDDIEFNKWMQSKAAAADPDKQLPSSLKCSKENMAFKPPAKKVARAPNQEMKSNYLSKHTILPLTKSKKILSKAIVSEPTNDRNVSEIEAKPIQQNALQDRFKMPLTTAPKTGKMRRSISSEHFAHSKQASVGISNVNIKKTPSEQNLFTDLDQVDPFNKFIGYRSTPLPTKVTQVKNYIQDTPLKRLQHPLKEWLHKRGKSLGNYQHLKCFGLQHLSEGRSAEDKENIPEWKPRSESYEELNISQTPETAKDNKAFEDNIVTGAVEDIHNLIVTGYHTDQCEAWLDFIKQKHKGIEKKPQYWECRAAIEQGRGNISTAVECYKNSIINGANVNQIDESLGNLLAKFSLLEIEAHNPVDAEKKRKAKEEEVRNIFKSTIIQFAIKERTLNLKDNKNNDGEELKRQFTGTPVRRSTRQSCPRFKNTPGKTIYDSWSDVENNHKDNVQFMNNSYLA